MANFTAQNSLNGLQTTTLFIAPTTGLYFVNGQLSLPSLAKGAVGPSAVVAVVNVAGSPVYTGTAGATGFQANVSCTAGDTVNVALSSSNAADQVLNVVTGVVGSGNAF